MWKEYGMAKEWSEFWRRSNEFDYEGTAGGEHQTMIRRANELHGELEPIDWSKFEATDIFDDQVYGIYEEQFIAVSRLDYDAYCEAAQHCEDMELLKAQESGLYDFDYGSYAAPEHHEVVTSEDGEVRGYVLSNDRVTGNHALKGPKDLTADQKDRMTRESGLYDYGHYGSYMVKKQQNEATDIKENKSTDTYDDHIASLYKETPMNHNADIDANDAVSGAIRPSHYESSNPDVPPIQMWDYALSQNLGFFEGNIVKYVSRWRQKGGVQDLQKALTYLKRLIESQGSPKP